MEHVPNLFMLFDVFVFRSDKHPHLDWSNKQFEIQLFKKYLKPI